MCEFCSGGKALNEKSWNRSRILNPKRDQPHQAQKINANIIRMGIDDKGRLTAFYYDKSGVAQEGLGIYVNYCPICGRKFENPIEGWISRVKQDGSSCIPWEWTNRFNSFELNIDRGAD